MVLKGVAIIGMVALAIGIAGCGSSTVANQTATSTPKNHGSSSDHVLFEGAASYTGAQNLSKWVELAQKNPKDYADQVQAGMAEFVNGHAQKAITYYKIGVKLDPEQGVAYTNIGNVYRADLNNYGKAIQYYRQSEKRDPQYGFGWYDLVYVYTVIEPNKPEANEVYESARKSLPTTSVYLTQMRSLLKSLH